MTDTQKSADLQEILGKVIRQERQNRRMTIKDLGDKAGLSEIYVGEIERGQKYPSAKVLESIATALDLGIADLLELVAEEIRHEREPQMTSAIGFTLPATPGQPRRLAACPRAPRGGGAVGRTRLHDLPGIAWRRASIHGARTSCSGGGASGPRRV